MSSFSNSPLVSEQTSGYSTFPAPASTQKRASSSFYSSLSGSRREGAATESHDASEGADLCAEMSEAVAADAPALERLCAALEGGWSWPDNTSKK